MSKKVLITGGAGFVGSNLAERLLRGGVPVLILDNLSRRGGRHNLRYLRETYGGLVETHVNDIRDKQVVEDLVARSECVFHLAAQVAVTTSLLEPVEDLECNLLGTLNLLEAIRRQDRKPPMLFTSTSKVYGDLRDIQLSQRGDRYVPEDPSTGAYGVSESRPLDFHSPHGCSKGAADQYVLDYARMYGLRATVFRMSCIYGRRQFGTEDQGWVAHFAMQILGNQRLTIYGDGRQVRDILYIDDLIDAMLLAMEEIEWTAGRAFNIGGGPDNAVSLLEVVRYLSELSGVEPEVRYRPWRKGDQPYYVSDTRRFSQATDWMPQIPVEQGIAQLHQWLTDHVRSGVLMSLDEQLR
jgi:CDP-paratose 2-epimerase